MWRRLMNTGYRDLELRGPGAVAHMSLHLNQRCQRADQNKRRTTIAPRLVTGGRLSVLCWRPIAGRQSVGSPSVGRHIWRRQIRVNTLLQFYFNRLLGARICGGLLRQWGLEGRRLAEIFASPPAAAPW